MATVFAGPGAARHLGDFGADVIKVEAPAGDGVRRMGWFPPEGRRLVHVEVARPEQAGDRARPEDPTPGATRSWRLVDGADVLIENFRPGTLERLGLGPDVLCAAQSRASSCCG